ncbi:MAG: hypothetical protein ACR2OE_04190 [Thermomicrobiales bacterium]
MLSRLRDWVKSRFTSNASSSTSTPTPRAQRTAQEAREDRAHSVTALQLEVRRLQQEITDISSTVEDNASGTSARMRTAAEAKLASLHSALEQKQREVAKFQARI